MTAKILFVDDEPDMQDLITQRFDPEIDDGLYEFIFASNGADALNKVKTHADIDVILTDINMPVMDGLTFLDRLQQETDQPLRAVVVSAYGDLKNIRTAMNRGAFDFLMKPIDFEDLKITLNKTLGLVREFRENMAQLQQAQLQLVQNEKMASLGQLVAGIAHEINNPVGFIAGSTSYAKQYLEDLLRLINLYQQTYPDPDPKILEEMEEIEFDYLLEDLPKLLNSLQDGAERIRQISQSLRTFSRLDSVQKIAFNVHEGIDSTLLILKHRTKANSDRPEIEVLKNYGNLPEIHCYPGQLNQVFMNLLANAIDALEESNQGRSFEEIRANPNQIKIDTSVTSDGTIVIKIADNGAGMSEAVKAKVFEYLFTTKAVGKGTGLGLSISRQVVEEKHQGKLYCESEEGQGTTFILELPIGDS